jgi:hypothetical protein
LIFFLTFQKEVHRKIAKYLEKTNSGTFDRINHLNLTFDLLSKEEAVDIFRMNLECAKEAREKLAFDQVPSPHPLPSFVLLISFIDPPSSFPPSYFHLGL